MIGQRRNSKYEGSSKRTCHVSTGFQVCNSKLLLLYPLGSDCQKKNVVLQSVLKYVKKWKLLFKLKYFYFVLVRIKRNS